MNKKKSNPLPVAKQARRKITFGRKLIFQTRSGKVRRFLLFWLLWERFTRSLWRLQTVPRAPYRLLEIRFTRHTGRAIDLPDGTHVSRGDPLIELHFRNRAILEAGRQIPIWQCMPLVGQSLRALACWMQEPGFPDGPRAIYSTTLLYRAAPRLGFTLRPRPKSMYARLERFFMMGLLVLYHWQGGARLLQGTTYETFPQETWMSRKELLRRYGGSGPLFPGEG